MSVIHSWNVYFQDDSLTKSQAPEVAVQRSSWPSPCDIEKNEASQRWVRIATAAKQHLFTVQPGTPFPTIYKWMEMVKQPFFI